MILKILGIIFVLWAVFGNAKDGFFGIYPKTPKGALQWWIRNPFHNLTHYVLNWKGGPFYQRQIGSKWFYAGWRPDSGALGIAYRPTKYGE